MYVSTTMHQLQCRQCLALSNGCQHAVAIPDIEKWSNLGVPADLAGFRSPPPQVLLLYAFVILLFNNIVFQEEESSVHTVAFSPDGQYIVAALPAFRRVPCSRSLVSTVILMCRILNNTANAAKSRLAVVTRVSRQGGQCKNNRKGKDRSFCCMSWNGILHCYQTVFFLYRF